MGAAAWTRDATDITERGAAVWGNYLTAQELSDRIGISVATIMDALTRRPLKRDPHSAIYRPAARIGQTRVAAVPMWEPAQADRYLDLVDARDEARDENRRRDLPVYNVAEIAEGALASTDEIAVMVGVAENTLRRWDRQHDDFPPEVAIAARVPPNQYGPPRTLRSIPAVKQWMVDHDFITPAVKQWMVDHSPTPGVPAA